jgi:hypothetical protein
VGIWRSVESLLTDSLVVDRDLESWRLPGVEILVPIDV